MVFFTCKVQNVLLSDLFKLTHDRHSFKTIQLEIDVSPFFEVKNESLSSLGISQVTYANSGGGGSVFFSLKKHLKH